jgi:class 3 adenylate cyclase
VAVALNRAFEETDLRDMLPAVRVPTLVLHRAPERANALEVASRIPSSRAVQVSGEDYLEIYLSPEVVDVIAEFIAGEEAPEVPESVLATVMFTDIVGSTESAARLGDRRWGDLIARHDELVRGQLDRYRGRPVKTLGDGFLATFDGPARAVRCASAIRDAVRSLNLEVRCGLHTGECELVGNDVAGIAVHTGARVAALAAPGEVLVSQTVRDLVAGSGLVLEEYGTYTLKGVPNEWRLFRAAD